MSTMRHYLARTLHMPSGELLERYVVAVDNGYAVEWYPFAAEFHSMIFVDDLYLRKEENGALKVVGSPL